MKSIKGLHHDPRISNYYQVGNQHIFIGFSRKNSRIIDQIQKLKDNARVHVFIPNIRCVDYMYLDRLLTFAFTGKDNNRQKPIYIHVPKGVKSFARLLKKEYLYGHTEKVSYRLIVESEGPRFRIPNSNSMLSINYGLKGINVSIQLKEDLYLDYDRKKPISHYHKNHGKYQEIWDTLGEIVVPDQLHIDHPKLFIKEMLDTFKANCPDILLTRFHSDIDIIQTILSRTEWGFEYGLYEKILQESGNIREYIEEGEST